MAELVDASDSKSEDRKVVWVRFPPEAPLKKRLIAQEYHGKPKP